MEKNFLEMLDSLPAEQKQPFIDHFVKTLLGKPTSPLISSTVKTISNDASLEERIRLTAEIYGIDPERIDKQQFLAGENEIAESKRQVKEIIGEHYGKGNDTGQRSKDDELISLGKFLYTTQLDFKITPTEIPDFILTNENQVIGLEHTRLEAGVDKAYIAEIWKKYLNGTLKIVQDRLPQLTGLINFTLDTDIRLFDNKALRDFNDKTIKANTPNIISELANFMIDQVNGMKPPLPKFVKSFSYQPSNEALSLKYNQDYFVRTDFTEMVASAILKKEQRINAYKENTQQNECWLLLVYSDASLSSGFKVNEHSLNSVLQTSFDRVFILNSFNQACFELQKGTMKLNYIAKKQFAGLDIKPLDH